MHIPTDSGALAGASPVIDGLMSINLRCYQNIYVERLQNKVYKTGKWKENQLIVLTD